LEEVFSGADSGKKGCVFLVSPQRGIAGLSSTPALLLRAQSSLTAASIPSFHDDLLLQNILYLEPVAKIMRV
jgi:hypothetical protein